MQAMPSPPTTTDQPSNAHAILSQTLSVIAAIAGLTAVRLLLLLSVIGAFYLATIAASNQSNASLFVMIAYSVLTVLPLVWLESRKR